VKERMSKKKSKTYNRQGMTKQKVVPKKPKKNSKQDRTWIRKADGVYLHRQSGFLYWRPWRLLNGKMTRTWESLETSNLTIAKERYSQLRYPKEGKPPVPSSGIQTGTAVTLGQVIRRYIADGYPDKHKAKRTGQTLDDETAHCELLLEFWDLVPVDQAGPAACDRYADWRKKRGFHHSTGERMIDRELNSLNNACRWAARCELIKTNPMRDRPKYQRASSVQHCREFMPRNSAELHTAAAHLFKHKHSVVLGFQLLSEAYTGLRTKEVLQWGQDIFGTTTGDFLNVWRLKGQHANNPYCNMHPGLQAMMKAHAAWKAVNFPNSPEFFPSHCGGSVDKGALAHALRRIRKKLERKLTSHGMRAFYVLVRRSQGATDEQIAHELGHGSNGACIRTTYGGVPDSWRTGGGPNMQWLPEDVPLAWAELERNGWKFTEHVEEAKQAA
jgi:hypothetical protein